MFRLTGRETGASDCLLRVLLEIEVNLCNLIGWKMGSWWHGDWYFPTKSMPHKHGNLWSWNVLCNMLNWFRLLGSSIAGSKFYTFMSHKTKFQEFFAANILLWFQRSMPITWLRNSFHFNWFRVFGKLFSDWSFFSCFRVWTINRRRPRETSQEQRKIVN